MRPNPGKKTQIGTRRRRRRNNKQKVIRIRVARDKRDMNKGEHKGDTEGGSAESKPSWQELIADGDSTSL